MPSEAAGFLSALGSPFVFRFITPALIVSWALIPLIPEPWARLIYLPALGVYIRIPVLTISRFLVYLVGLFSIGFILRGLYPVHTGMLFGVLLPRGLRAWAISRLERHVPKAQSVLAAVSPSIGPTSRQWWEAVRARDFLDQLPRVLNPQTGAFDPVIRAPTMYGNLIAALIIDVGRREQARSQIRARQQNPPPRWLGKEINPMVAGESTLQGDDRREYDQVAAVAEAALSCSLGFTLLVPVYVWAVLWSMYTNLPGTGGNVVMVVACGFLAYIAYRICLYQARVSCDLLRGFLAQRPL